MPRGYWLHGDLRPRVTSARLREASGARLGALIPEVSCRIGPKDDGSVCEKKEKRQRRPVSRVVAHRLMNLPNRTTFVRS